MADRPILTTESGAPVADNQHSQTAGPTGPVLLQDQHLLEKLARFNRERIPERVVHARGSGAYGHFEVTTDVRRWTKAQGIECLASPDAVELAGLNPESYNEDLVNAIESGQFPSWTLKVQVMPAADAPGYKVNPFDLTKVWNYADYPLIEIGKLVLDRNPDNYFAHVEQSGFDPGNFVPGIGPSPDKMLQGRLFAYGDAHRYRLGVNHTQLPVNAPHATEAHNYGRDGAMKADENGGRSKNYEPNSFNGPVETGRPLYAGLATGGDSGTYEWRHHDGDDFSQAGDLYRLQPADAQARLVENIATGLSQVSPGAIGDGIVERTIAHFRTADPEYGARIEAEVKQRRSS